MSTGEKKTPHQPERRRTLSGRYVEIDKVNKGWVVAPGPKAEPVERTGEYYQRMKDVPVLTPKPLQEAEVESETQRWASVATDV